MSVDVKGAIPELEVLIQEFAQQRAIDVTAGRQTPRLAAAMLRKYGLGVCHAASTMSKSPAAGQLLSRTLDDELSKLNPDWKGDEMLYWDGRPADMVIQLDSQA